MFVPVNKLGVALQFTQSAPLLGFALVETSRTCDAVFMDVVYGRQVRINFEVTSRNLAARAAHCDLAVCWLHNWPACPVPVLALRDVAASLVPVPRVPFAALVASLPAGTVRLLVRKSGGQLSVLTP